MSRKRELPPDKSLPLNRMGGTAREMKSRKIIKGELDRDARRKR